MRSGIRVSMTFLAKASAPSRNLPSSTSASTAPHSCASLALKGLPGHVGFERLLDPDQARQALGSAGAGNDAELDLRQSELRGRHGDAVVAGLGQFEAAAERRAVDRRNDRLGASLDRRLNVEQRGPLGRLAEFGNVGAGDEGAAVADQHDGLDRGVGRRLRDAGTEAVADVGGKRVDRRRVDRDHGDVAFAGEIGHGIDGGHFARSLCFPPVLYISSHNEIKGDGEVLSCRCSILTAKSRSSPGHRGASAAPSSSGWPSTERKVVVSSRKAEPCQEVADAINAKYGKGRAVAIPANISSKEELAHLAEETTRVFGQIDILVCNAASNPHYGPLNTITDEQFTKTLSNNIISNHWLINLVAPQMIARKDGSIIIVSSVGGLRGSAILGAYCVSKAADFQLARNLAIEFGPHNVRINCIAPGLIRTYFAKALWENPENLKRATSRTPLGRIGEPDEIAGAAILLASKAGTFMTGQAIVIDGGNTIT